MHPTQKQFCENVKIKFPEYFYNTFILDVGSLDLNGCNRYLFTDGVYLGLDIAPGKNVDIISKIHEAPFRDGLFNVVCSTSALEHDMFWRQSIPKMVNLLCPGGLMFFSCGHKWFEHGTSKSHTWASATSNISGWKDYYHNLTEAEVRSVIDLTMFSSYEFSLSEDQLDLQFWGIRV